jgi:curved DNA-binding protein CbpA
MIKNVSKFDSLGYYEVLECSPNSTDEELRTKYRELAKFWHPDQNKDPKAVDMFQKIAVAYEVLKNPIDRLKYNLLSIVYKKEDFPQMDALSVIKSIQGKEDLNLRAIRLIEVTGKGFGCSKIDKIYYCTQNEAKWVVKQITKHNWLYGFLGLKAIFANFGAICKNFSNLNNPKENLKLFVHNAIAYSLENRDKDAVTSLAIAKEFADKLMFNLKKFIKIYVKNIYIFEKNKIRIEWIDYHNYNFVLIINPFDNIMTLDVFNKDNDLNKQIKMDFYNDEHWILINKILSTGEGI